MNESTQSAVKINIEQELEKPLKSGDLVRAKEIVESIDTSSISNVKVILQCSAIYRGLGDQNQAVEFSAKAANLQPDNPTPGNYLFPGPPDSWSD